MNKLQTTLDGMLNILAITNFGINSLSEKQTSRSIDKALENKGLVENPVFYLLGLAFGFVGVELGTFTFSVYETINGNPKYLLGYAGLKVLMHYIGYRYDKVFNASIKTDSSIKKENVL